MAVTIRENIDLSPITEIPKLDPQDLQNGKPAMLVRGNSIVLGEVQRQTPTHIYFSPYGDGRKPKHIVSISSELETGKAAFFEHPQLSLPEIAPEDFYQESSNSYDTFRKPPLEELGAIALKLRQISLFEL